MPNKVNNTARAAIIILTAISLALSGCGGKNDPDPDTDTEPTETSAPVVSTMSYDEAAELLAQAVTITQKFGGIVVDGELTDNEILEIMGRYQALLFRKDGRESITEYEAMAFQTALGGNSEVLVEVPEYMKDSGYCVLDIGDDGVMTFSFPICVAELEEALGISYTLETYAAESSIDSRMVYHEDGKNCYAEICRVGVERSGGAFPCRMTGLEILPDLTMVGGSIEFVQEQNKLSNLLAVNESIRLYIAYPDTKSITNMIYFMVGDQYASLECAVGEDKNEYVVTRNIPDQNSGDKSDEIPFETDIASLISNDGSVLSVTEYEDTQTYELFISDKEYWENGWKVYTLDRDTLRLISADFYDPEGNVCAIFSVDTDVDLDYYLNLPDNELN